MEPSFYNRCGPQCATKAQTNASRAKRCATELRGISPFTHAWRAMERMRKAAQMTAMFRELSSYCCQSHATLLPRSPQRSSYHPTITRSDGGYSSEAPLFRVHTTEACGRGGFNARRACRAHSSQETAFVVRASIDHGEKPERPTGATGSRSSSASLLLPHCLPAPTR